MLILLGVLLLAAACTLNSNPARIPPTATRPVATFIPLPTSAPTFTPPPTNTPSSGTPACTPRSDWTIVYVVVAGDTMSSLAVRTRSTVSELASGNCLSNPNAITAGQQLRVPRTPQSAPPPTVIVPTVPTGTIQTGAVSISASITSDAGFVYLLRGETVVVTWQNPPSGLSTASFALYSTGGIMQTIGDDPNPADGVSIAWSVPAGLNGQQLMASGRFSTGTAVASSYPVNVASAPPRGQGCEITPQNAGGATVYMGPNAASGAFGMLSRGQYVEVLGRSLNGWYGFDPAAAQAGATGAARLRWVAVDTPLYGRGNCAGIPPEPQPGQTQTFTNTIVGIAIDYPAGWSASALNNDIVLSGPNGNTFEVTYRDAGSTRPPQDDAATCKSVGVCIGNRTVTAESALTLPSGIAGYRLDLSGDPAQGYGPAVYTFVILSNRNMVLRGFGDLSVYNTILNTVRPA